MISSFWRYLVTNGRPWAIWPDHHWGHPRFAGTWRFAVWCWIWERYKESREVAR